MTWFSKSQNESAEEIEPFQIPEWIADEAVWFRLEDQLGWYDKKSSRAQRWYKSLKFTQIGLAVFIPIASHFDPGIAKWITSVSGALIAILEGVQHMNQYSTLWITYRSTTEYLRHEKFLFLSGAGPYKSIDNREQLILLAERIEERVSAEHANWFNEMKRATTKKHSDTDDT